MLQCAAMSEAQQHEIELTSASEAETIMIGAEIGARLRAGDLVLLQGPFGAGKTHLTRGIAAGLGADPADVNSPSFVVINEYRAGAAHGRMPIFHVDLYRVETEHELGTIGLEDCIDGHGVCVIEWAERVAGWLPPDRLVVEIEPTGPTGRRLRLIANGERYRRLLEDFPAGEWIRAARQEDRRPTVARDP